tara:strand:- start:80 stop:280 length:201 start_codon:yes stop_codon:yes gene_type:complete
MANKELQKLENQIHKLVKLSSQLQEANQHLLKKNTLLKKENTNIFNAVTKTKDKIKRLVSHLEGEK